MKSLSQFFSYPFLVYVYYNARHFAMIGVLYILSVFKYKCKPDLWLEAEKLLQKVEEAQTQIPSGHKPRSVKAEGWLWWESVVSCISEQVVL